MVVVDFLHAGLGFVEYDIILLHDCRGSQISCRISHCVTMMELLECRRVRISVWRQTFCRLISFQIVKRFWAVDSTFMTVFYELAPSSPETWDRVG